MKLRRKLYRFTKDEADLIGDAMNFLLGPGIKITRGFHYPQDIVPTEKALQTGVAVRKRLGHWEKGLLGHSGKFFQFDDPNRLIGQEVEIRVGSVRPNYNQVFKGRIKSLTFTSGAKYTQVVLEGGAVLDLTDTNIANLMYSKSTEIVYRDGERVS